MDFSGVWAAMRHIFWAFGLILGFALRPSLLAAEPVLKWMDTHSSLSYRNGLPTQSFQARILVKNLSYEKSVVLYMESEGHPPQTLMARYLGPATEGYEIWEAESALDPQNYRVRVVAQLDRRYELDAVAIAADSGPVLHNGQRLQALHNPRQAHAGQRLRLEAVTEGVSSQDHVFVHISRDGWKTQQVLPLQSFEDDFDSTRAQRAGLWGIDLSLPVDVVSLSYYFSLESAGTVAFDNNFGNNYELRFR